MGEQILNIEKKAIEILNTNRVGWYTRPSSDIYPHQWNWDTAFIAIGRAHFDPVGACEEIQSLFRGQWKNGMIPHIIFNPKYSHYEPGPDFWETENIPAKPDNMQTSGITQPPLLPYAADIVGGHLPKKEKTDFFRKVYPFLRNYLLFLLQERTFKGCSLPGIFHPWESGLDNSPRWDEPLLSVDKQRHGDFSRMDKTFVDPSQRPDDKDYEKYYNLVRILGKYKYDQHLLRTNSPFFVIPLLFNVIFLRSLDSLIKIGDKINEDTSMLKAYFEKVKSDFMKFLSIDDTFGDFNVRNSKTYYTDTAVQFTPLFISDLLPFDIEKLFHRIKMSEGYSSPGIIKYPTVSTLSKIYSPIRYWRGPVWININWILYNGFLISGYPEEATALKTNTLGLIERSGFREYYNPETGDGLGAHNFSWTAALAVDLIRSKFKE